MNGSMSGIPGFGPLFDKRANMEMITGKRKTMFVPRVQSVSEGESGLFHHIVHPHGRLSLDIDSYPLSPVPLA